MAGLLCKELIIRGDVERCLVIAPSSLVEQCQDELRSKFGLNFEILTKGMIEAARSGNPFAEKPMLIAHPDHLAVGEHDPPIARHFLLMTATPHAGIDRTSSSSWPSSTRTAARIDPATART